ncbi:MAG: dihydrofolate reductase family protein [Pseudonocardia sediminis]
MGVIKAHEFTTLDGVIGAPMWTMDYGFTDDMGASIGRLTGSSEAIIFGRTTWEESGPAWSSRDMETDPGAPFFNNTPKYVVSGTRTDAEGWNNSHLLGAYDVETIRTFKDGIDGGIYTYGSGTLVRALLADGLLDELHLYVFPLALGEGPRMFPEGSGRTALTLAGTEAFSNGVVHLTYTQPAS